MKLFKYYTMLFVLLLTFSTLAYGQKHVIDDDGYAVSADVMPSPVGGLDGLQERIHYPEIVKRAGIEGRVFVKAFIGADGVVTKAEIAEGVDGLNDAALTAVKESKFTPAQIDGKPVKAKVMIPIVFKI